MREGDWSEPLGGIDQNRGGVVWIWGGIDHSWGLSGLDLREGLIRTGFGLF